MKSVLELISEEVKKAFVAAGYDEKLGAVTVSNRPDLCEYQCNGAMAGAKQYKKPPLSIAQEVAANLENSEAFSSVEAVAPGFLNLKLSEKFLSEFIENMMKEDKYGVELSDEDRKTIIIDYGGPNVAKPLHVGHLRPAIIGESIKRICRYAGHNVIGDVHLGDWGLPMGQIITELNVRKPDLVYFDESFEGEYPEEAPFTISELEEIYPFASGKCKTDDEYKAKALKATAELQKGRRGYRALWQHILKVSVTDLKKNYEKLDVHFELWNGESDVHDRIPAMVQYMKDGGYAYLSEGALVVDVKEEDDKKEIKIDVMLEQCLNLYIICKLKNENLINENEYYYLKEKIENLKNLSVDMKKNSI